MNVSVRELKNHLSEYLRRVQAGEQVSVTSRGKVIATLSPAAHATGAETGEEAVRRLRSMPWVQPAENPGGLKGPDRSIEVPAGTTDEIMDWVRGR